MTNFDALYHSVYTAANEAIGTDGISPSLAKEIKDVILKAWEKDEYKYSLVTLESNDRYLDLDSRQYYQVYMEKPIAMYNAITVFMHSTNFDVVHKSFKKLESVLKKSADTLRDHIEADIHRNKAMLKYFICPTCGTSFQLYVFDSAKKNRIVNIPVVSNVINGYPCWKCAGATEQGAELPF